MLNLMGTINVVLFLYGSFLLKYGKWLERIFLGVKVFLNVVQCLVSR